MSYPYKKRVFYDGSVTPSVSNDPITEYDSVHPIRGIAKQVYILKRRIIYQTEVAPVVVDDDQNTEKSPLPESLSSFAFARINKYRLLYQREAYPPSSGLIDENPIVEYEAHPVLRELWKQVYIIKRRIVYQTEVIPVFVDDDQVVEKSPLPESLSSYARSRANKYRLLYQRESYPPSFGFVDENPVVEYESFPALREIWKQVYVIKRRIIYQTEVAPADSLGVVITLSLSEVISSSDSIAELINGRPISAFKWTQEGKSSTAWNQEAKSSSIWTEEKKS